jgi:hypothetical protein
MICRQGSEIVPFSDCFHEEYGYPCEHTTAALQQVATSMICALPIVPPSFALVYGESTLDSANVVSSVNPPPADAKMVLLILGVVGAQLALDWLTLTHYIPRSYFLTVLSVVLSDSFVGASASPLVASALSDNSICASALPLVDSGYVYIYVCFVFCFTLGLNSFSVEETTT